ncbi:hypothetical protein A4D02_31680 [Niastella koreensis]|nr:T9SS type A sorting domain-containing protein [Niastella koreensis]OQP46359.1 hypothetical protein A4D02_31680 [Niastella koreensis]
MKLDSRTPANIRWLLVILWVVLSTSSLIAQCPGGSTLNTAGTYNNGTNICITTAFSGNISLNNGATLTITSGGNYTGTLDAKKGSIVNVQKGGTLAATANNFAATLTNLGTVGGNITVDDGAAITNTGTFNWNASWNQNNTIVVTNNACGTMTFAQNTNVKASAQIINNGVLTFSSGVTTDNGTTINNRGTITFNDVNISGSFINQSKAIFKGNNNTINSSQVADSLVNTGTITVSNSLTTSISTRNEGLLWVGGSYTINGQAFKINNSNAYVRVGGALSNNGQISGNGSLYIGGSIVNNQSISGNGPAAQLTVNKSSGSIGGTTFAINYNTGLASKDTTNYTPTMSNAASCAVLADKMSALQAVYNNGRVQLNWFAYAQANARSFTIEYSLDGLSFTPAGELTGAASNDATTPYTYVYSPGVTGTVYYRIRETDFNGNYYYTNVVVVRTGNTFTVGTEVFPNPFKDLLQISMQLEKAGVIQVALYDASGRQVKKVQQQGLLGRNTIVMSNLTTLLPGVYLVQVKADNHTLFDKLIK